MKLNVFFWFGKLEVKYYHLTGFNFRVRIAVVKLVSANLNLSFGNAEIIMRGDIIIIPKRCVM